MCTEKQNGYQPTNKVSGCVPPSNGSVFDVNSDDKTCDNCIKSDVCNIKEDIIKSTEDIFKIVNSIEDKIKVSISCNKFAAKNKYTGIR
ncbi:MAG: hypothetical protein K0R54_5447 [Clostridiaceae bacterium]|jgi:hypothetical protein|nr:hypothetical protein [Clostridiaceae bacterium]MDF2950499.1 hypothetical protein [Anaerocolumna sp.]